MTARAAREAGLVAGLVAIGVALPLSVYALAAVLDVPYSDEFTFRRAALDFYRTGELQLGGWLMKTFVGQLLAVQPLLVLGGGAAWAFPVAAAAFTTTGIIAAYALARQFLPVGRAVLAVLLVLVYPGFLVTAPTFMTDIPAWAAMLASLALGARALDPGNAGRGRLLALALGAGVFAFSIREFGLAAPVAVLASASLAWWTARRRRAAANGAVSGEPAARGSRNGGSWNGGSWNGRTLLFAWATTVAACFAVFLFTTLAGQSTARLHEPGAADVARVHQAVATTALMVGPALALAWVAWIRRGAWSDRWVVAGAGAGLVAGILLYRTELAAAVGEGGLPRVILGNVLAVAGSTGSGAGAGTRPTLFVSPTWTLLNLAALAAVLAGSGLLGASAAAVARVATGRGRSALLGRLGTPGGLLVTFCGLYLSGTLVLGLVSSLFDRYLWPLIVPLGILLLAGPDAFRGPHDLGAGNSSRAPVASGSRLAYRLVRLAGAASAAALVAGLSAASLALLLNRAAFDSARWEAGRQLVEAGIPADRVDAGYEWVGDHAAALLIPAREPRPDERWYHLVVPDFRPCAIVAASSLVEPGIVLQDVSTAAYRLLLIGGPPMPLYVYRTDEAGCP